MPFLHKLRSRATLSKQFNFVKVKPQFASTGIIRTFSVSNGNHQNQNFHQTDSNAAHANVFPSNPIGFGLLVAATASAGYYTTTKQNQNVQNQNIISCQEPQKALNQSTKAPQIGQTNWSLVKKEVINLLEDDKYMEEPLGPFFLRLAWHTSGTYCKHTKTGGSDGATMRFPVECQWDANAGLVHAQKLLDPICKQNPSSSISDIWIFAACVAIEEMMPTTTVDAKGNPLNQIKIPFREGRIDKPMECTPTWKDEKYAPCGKLPDSGGNYGEDMEKNASHLRLIFNRMGFDDREIVCLSGAHGLGRCHEDRSGHWGPWTNAPTTISNEYFRILVEEKWTKKQTHCPTTPSRLDNDPNSNKKWTGPYQYEDKTKQLMMLPSDMCLITDKEFKKWVDIYHKDEDRFLKDFAKVVVKLFENGIDFEERHGLKENWYNKMGFYSKAESVKC